MLIRVALRSKPWVCYSMLAGIAGSNPAVGNGCQSLLSVMCCPVQVSGSGSSLVQRIPADRCVSERDCETSIKIRIWPTRSRSTIWYMYVGKYQMFGKKTCYIHIRGSCPNIL